MRTFLIILILSVVEGCGQEIISIRKGSGNYPLRGMWDDTFITGVWVTSTPPENLVTDSTQVFVYEYSAVMNNTGLLNEENYSLLDSNNTTVPIYSLIKLDSLGGLTTTQGTTLVAAVIPTADSGMVYKLKAFNLKRNNGAPIDTSDYKYYYHNWGQ